MTAERALPKRGQPTDRRDRDRRAGNAAKDLFDFDPTASTSFDHLLVNAPRELMTAEDEIRLAKRRDEAWYGLNDLNPDLALNALDGSVKYSEIYPILPDKEAELLRAYQKCINEFIERNLRLIPYVIKRYNFNAAATPSVDLFQEGVFGLNSAARKFDHSKELKFSTYAFAWIRQSMQRSRSNTEDTIRLPVHAGDIIRRIDRAERTLTASLGRAPTLSEMVEESNLEPREVEEYSAYRYRFAQLDMPVGGDDSDATLGDLIPSDKDVERDALGGMNVKSALKEISAVLSEQEFVAFIYTFGCGIVEPKSNVAIAKRLRVTSSKVSSLVDVAIAKLAHPASQRVREVLFEQ